MSKREKKSHFGKRLWDSITEPLPDDNDDQNNEQIPLAYDLKDSAESAPAKPASSAESTAASSATKATKKQHKQPVSEASAASAAASKSHQSKSAAASKQSSEEAKAAVPASEAKAPKLAEPAKSKRSATKKSAKRTHKQAAQSAADTKAGRTPASAATPKVASAASQPKIAVRGTESADDDQPELPLSREELYGDQQPNGGREPEKRNADNMSRVARHADRIDDEAADEHDDADNPHLKKKSRKSGHYSWKLMGVGVAILVVAGLGALLMWNRAKTAQADAKSNAEAIVQAIYTSSAQRDLRANASTDQLKQLQTNIDNMKDSSEKDRLQKQYDYASQMMQVRSSYRELRNTAGLINIDVTTKSIAKDRQKIVSTGLTNDKAYFAKKYDKQFKATSKTVKKVAGYDAAFKKLYTKKGKLKSTTPSSDIDVIQSNLKAYRKKSQLAANDYQQLKADRKKLAKTASSSSSSYSSSSSSYSEPESSSSSSSSETSSDSDTSSTTSDSSSTSTYYGGGNDTQTSSAAESSSTTHYSSHSKNNNTTGTGTGNTTDQTTGGTTTNDTTTTDNN
ncbi:hypothetical protein [Lactiplantibacillus xiangfangensis]|uniref:Uncharacterized protein n=1 Tax=Lactiplantibacillus xiangfangensis TaxID=942150 RepID=A0A0R2M863_9LACO|nr:hypothetical protein [Lactiplantibacillus xiangfangensis]KRO08050.1 hypothetical protein IV64_GL000899 [Lactiplantibacillus xiangfangensis]